MSIFAYEDFHKSQTRVLTPPPPLRPHSAAFDTGLNGAFCRNAPMSSFN